MRILCATAIGFALQTNAQPVDMEAYKDGVKFAAELAKQMCESPQLRNSIAQRKASAEVKAEVTGLIKYLSKLGFGVSAEMSAITTTGLLPSQFSEAFIASVNCRVRLVESIKADLAPPSRFPRSSKPVESAASPSPPRPIRSGNSSDPPRLISYVIVDVTGYPLAVYNGVLALTSKKDGVLNISRKSNWSSETAAPSPPLAVVYYADVLVFDRARDLALSLGASTGIQFGTEPQDEPALTEDGYSWPSTLRVVLRQ